MRRVVKIAGFGVLGLVLVAIAAFIFFYARVEAARGKTISVDISPISIPVDALSIAEGKRLVQTKACADCHGPDLGGATFINDPPVGVFVGSNLTPGKGSVVAGYKDTDWIRSIRYAISPNGHPLVFMPSGDFHGISNEELGRMIAYLKSLPPVDRENPASTIGPVGRVLYNLGQLPLLFPYEEIDFSATPIESVTAAATEEYGKYLSMACIGCHGSGFSGGRIPGTPPQWPAAKNLTPASRVAKWTLDEFKKTLREGLPPDGQQINPQFMPWKSMQAMNDVEIEALYKFFQKLPPKPDGMR